MPYIQPPVVKPFKPVDQFTIQSCEPFDACTVYKSSFGPHDSSGCRPTPVRQHDNIQASDCKIDDCTIHKLSYTCHPCVKASPFLPCNRNILERLGAGPLSCVTTQRHDFVPKCVPKVQPIIRPTALRCSVGAIDNCSIMRASYQPPCKQERTQSFKPIAKFTSNEEPFHKETVARMSYVPWPLKQKEHYPWKCKKSCPAPSVPMDCKSIYQSSYFAPGEFV